VSTTSIVRQHAARAVRNFVGAPTVASVPEGRMVELPGRGRTFVVDVPGPEGAPTLVLLHALGCTSYLSWYPVLADLAEHYRIVLFDQRWHGRGIRSPRFRFEDCADDVAAVLDVLEIKTCIPVGYSMGGAIAQLVWRQHPDRVDGLVLCSTARNFRGKRREQVFFPDMTAAMLPLAAVCRGRVERLAAALPEVPSAVADARGWGLAEFRSTSAWSMPAVLEALGRFNSAPWIGEVDVPTSVVVTAKDHTIPERRQRRLAAAIPGAEVFEVDGGHASLVLKAGQFGPALLEATAAVVARGSKRRKKSARVG
jgi:pimeloyl-ACP methyl ester carboxylesterase